MKRCSSLIFTIFLFASAQAQENWFGVRTGYPLGITLHYGIENGLDNGFDLRISGNLRAYGNKVEVGIGIDGMNDIIQDGPFSLYLGGGPSLDFGGGGALLGLHGLVGGEIRLSGAGLGSFGIFVEGSLGASIGLGRDSRVLKQLKVKNYSTRQNSDGCKFRGFC
jgi:hypothetical protein